MGQLIVPNYQWQGLQNIGPHSFTCGHCGVVASTAGGYYAQTQTGLQRTVRICSNCYQPTYVSERGIQIPGARSGRNVDALPPDVKAIYDEARAALSSGAPTGCVLLCRTLLAHVAEEKGSTQGDSFQNHVKYLADNGYIPGHSKAWVDQIRVAGNAATHDLEIVSPDDATKVVVFAEMVLQLVYELPSKVPTSNP